MASKTNKKAEQKQKMVRVVAIVACGALLLTAILPYIASSLLYRAKHKTRRFSSERRRAFYAPIWLI